MMERIQSSAISGAEYDDKNRRLTIQFAGGKLLELSDVPEHIFHGLLNAESAGKYWHENIKGKFR